MENRQVTFAANIHPTTLYVLADSCALSQAIVDIVRNALDACQAGDRIEFVVAAGFP